MPAFPYLEFTLLFVLLVASAFDVAVRRIPNLLLLTGLLAALALHTAFGHGWALLTVYLAGFVVGLLMFLPLHIAGGMAAGDVKLMATVGAFLGPVMAFQASLATYCIGGVLALLIVLAKQRGRAALANVRAVMRPVMMRLARMPTVKEPMPHESVGGMPYAVAITLGTVAALWLRYS